jgi:hypothetical protein
LQVCRSSRNRQHGKFKRVPAGARDEPLDQTSRSREITDPEKQRRRVDQRYTQRHRMISQNGFVDGLLRSIDRSVRETTQPKRTENARRARTWWS